MVVLPLWFPGWKHGDSKGCPCADGSVIVGSDFRASSPQAGSVWTQSGGTVLVSIPGYDHPWLSALTADGSLAGGTATLSNRTHAFLWSISEGHTATFLPDPFPTGNAESVLADPGRHGRVPETAATRLRWGPGNTVVTLGDLGLGTSLATGISTHGTAIVGHGRAITRAASRSYGPPRGPGDRTWATRRCLCTGARSLP